MHKALTTLSAVAVALTIAFGAGAQSREGQSFSEPGLVGKAETATITGTITKVDQGTRDVTVVGSNGKEVTVTAGPEVRNFAQLKAGDKVAVQYAQALVVELKKGGGKVVARTEEKGMARAAPGATPGGAVGRQVTVVGDVMDLDAATQTIRVRGPQRTVDIKVRDPEQFKLIAKGDQLEATYVEAIAVDVSPAAPK